LAICSFPFARTFNAPQHVLPAIGTAALTPHRSKTTPRVKSLEGFVGLVDTASIACVLLVSNVFTAAASEAARCGLDKAASHGGV
jgi:hypothetical protein